MHLELEYGDELTLIPFTLEDAVRGLGGSIAPLGLGLWGL